MTSKPVGVEKTSDYVSTEAAGEPEPADEELEELEWFEKIVDS